MGSSRFVYAQVRLQAHYGKRVDDRVWLRLHNIFDLASYLHFAQQTSLRSWLLGINAEHSSHEIERALRQKYRSHVDDVTSWLPVEWRPAFYWIKRLPDLSILQYLVAGGRPLDWMRSDPVFRDFTADDVMLRQQALNQAGYGCLVKSWQQGDSMIDAWLAHWEKLRPHSKGFEKGMEQITMLLLKQLLLERKAGFQEIGLQEIGLPETGLEDALNSHSVFSDESGTITASLSSIFRRYAFQPAAVCAYLAIISVDIHRIRGDLMQRLFFQDTAGLSEAGLPEASMSAPVQLESASL